MKGNRHWQSLVGVAGLGLMLANLTGCQTWVAGMTLPSGRYLQHPPQYFPPSPPFPLSRELAYQQTVAAQGAPGTAAVAPLPPPVVPPIGPAPGIVRPEPAPAP
jgi:hypothetical protein